MSAVKVRAMNKNTAAFALLAVLALTGCTAQAEPAATPTPTTDVRAEAVTLLGGSLEAGSPGTTEEQRQASLDLAIETLSTFCTDPNAPISGEAYDLLTGAQSVLENNGIQPCEAFG